jgi:hypothetical protein
LHAFWGRSCWRLPFSQSAAESNVRPTCLHRPHPSLSRAKTEQLCGGCSKRIERRHRRSRPKLPAANRAAKATSPPAASIICTQHDTGSDWAVAHRESITSAIWDVRTVTAIARRHDISALIPGYRKIMNTGNFRPPPG